LAVPQRSLKPWLGTERPSMRAKREAGSGKLRASRVAPGGFEPPFSDPKSDVLPLDEGADVLAVSLQSYSRTSTWTTRDDVRVGMTSASTLRSPADGGEPSKTPKTAEPDPARWAICAPLELSRSRNRSRAG
jgi:hypothetical protein